MNYLISNLPPEMAYSVPSRSFVRLKLEDLRIRKSRKQNFDTSSFMRNESVLEKILVERWYPR